MAHSLLTTGTSLGLGVACVAGVEGSEDLGTLAEQHSSYFHSHVNI